MGQELDWKFEIILEAGCDFVQCVMGCDEFIILC